MPIAGVILFFLIFIMSVVCHEVAHAYMAYLCGDDTAKRMGRITLNPIPHIDLWWSIIMPVILYISRSPVIFGGAKPVPVNPYNYRNYRRGDILVSIAGVITNFLIAVGLSLILRLLLTIKGISPNFIIVVGLGIILNILLGVFNLIPIPPLDGSHILKHFLPRQIRQGYERIGFFGIFIIFIFIFTFGHFLMYVILFFWSKLLLLDVDLFWGILKAWMGRA